MVNQVDLPIRSPMSQDDVHFERRHISESDWPLYTGGVALPIEEACLDLGQAVMTKAVGPSDRSAVFRVELEKGGYHLRAWFQGKNGLSLGSYYTDVYRDQCYDSIVDE